MAHGKRICEKKNYLSASRLVDFQTTLLGTAYPACFLRKLQKTSGKFSIFNFKKKSKSKIRNLRFNKGELENPGWIAAPEKDLPVKLPYIKNFKPLGKGESPLASIE